MKIYVAGHSGLVGSALCRRLQRRGNTVIGRFSRELDLRNQAAVNKFIQEIMPDRVYVAAARVGGIHANNSNPADFLYDNLMIASNIISAAHKFKVPRLLFLGSSCIYPRNASQPMTEECLLTGILEPTNEAYAVAKIAGLKLCESYNRQHGTDFRAVMPTNLYGPGDNFDLENSHVLPAMIRRFHEAKLVSAPVVTLWGTGSPCREFLHVDDLADACEHVMNLDYDKWAAVTAPTRGYVNVGTGDDIEIEDLAHMIADIVGYTGTIEWDTSKPDGTPKKLLDISRIKSLGWQPRIPLEQGIREVYSWYTGASVIRGNRAV